MTARQQPLRNLLHLSTVVSAFWVLHVDGTSRMVVPAAMLLLAGMVDLGRLWGAGPLVDRMLPGVYRHPEPLGVSGATLLATGYFAAALLFPAPAAAAGIVAAAIGDPAAAVVGRWYGARHEARGKTWIGSLALFATSATGLVLLPGVGVAPAVAGAAAAALVERRAGALDNLLVPSAVAIVVGPWLG